MRVRIPGEMIFLDTGRIPEALVHAAIRKTGLGPRIIRAVHHGRPPSREAYGAAAYFRYDEMSKPGARRVVRREVYGQVLERLLADHQATYIMERARRRDSMWGSSMLDSMLLSRYVWNSVAFLEEHDVRCLLFQSVPHNPWPYVLARTAEALGIPVFMLQSSPLPWRYWVVRGMDDQVVQPVTGAANLLQGDAGVVEEARVRAFIERQRRGAADAIPSYERERVAQRRGRFWNWRAELLDAWRVPGRVRYLWPKRQLYLAYQAAVRPSVDAGLRKIVLFLHYQPEASSMPDGGPFGQQSIIVDALSQALPTGWELLVKEHPSTFTDAGLQIGYRSARFYEQVAELPNVRCVPLEESAHRLIAGADAIATIAGTVGVQALINGRRVLAFGRAPYRGAPGVHAVQRVEGVPDAIAWLQSFMSGDSPDASVAPATVDAYLERCLQQTAGAAPDNRPLEQFDPYARAHRPNGHGVLLELFLAQVRDRLAD